MDEVFLVDWSLQKYRGNRSEGSPAEGEPGYVGEMSG